MSGLNVNHRNWRQLLSFIKLLGLDCKTSLVWVSEITDILVFVIKDLAPAISKHTDSVYQCFSPHWSVALSLTWPWTCPLHNLSYVVFSACKGSDWWWKNLFVLRTAEAKTLQWLDSVFIFPWWAWGTSKETWNFHRAVVLVPWHSSPPETPPDIFFFLSRFRIVWCVRLSIRQ